jgi:hypothetical protein
VSVSLRFVCDAILDRHSTCGRAVIVNVDGETKTTSALRAAGWSGSPMGGAHACDHHSGIPPIPARVPSRALDAPSAARGVPIPTNVTPFRRPHA